MDEPTIYGLLNSLSCIVTLCCGFLSFGTVAGGMIYLMYRNFKKPTPQEIKNEEGNLQNKVRDLMGEVREWKPESLSDLSSDWNAKWSYSSVMKAHGTIPSLEYHESASWVAFALQLRGFSSDDGMLYARTAQHTFEYRFVPGGAVTISLNDSPFGKIQADGALLDAEGKTIGEARRGNVKRGDKYPLVLNGKAVGQITKPAMHEFNLIKFKETPRMPAVSAIETKDEGDLLWLLALAILETAGYNVRASLRLNRTRRATY